MSLPMEGKQEHFKTGSTFSLDNIAEYEYSIIVALELYFFSLFCMYVFVKWVIFADHLNSCLQAIKSLAGVTLYMSN